jgi:hypothetical protein
MTDVRTIATGDLCNRLDQTTKFEFWNVLTDKWFTGEMIPGSRRMPLDTIEQRVADVPKDAEIVTYCGGPKCPQSIEAQETQRPRLHQRPRIRGRARGLEGCWSLHREA